MTRHNVSEWLGLGLRPGPWMDSALMGRWFLVLVLTMSAVSGDPEVAWAAASTFGDVVCNVRNNLVPYTGIFSVIAYAIAAFLAARFGWLLMQQFQDSKSNKIPQALGSFVASACFFSLPYFVKALQTSLFSRSLASGGGGVTGCVPVPVTPVPADGNTAGLDLIIQNLTSNIHQPMMSLISIISIAVGLFLIGRGLIRSTKLGTDPKVAGPHIIVVNLLIGAALVSIGEMLPTMTTTLFGDSAVHSMKNFSLRWSEIVPTGTDTTAANKTIQAVLGFVQIIGAISFLRGWLIVRRAVEGAGQATVPQGITHILGGTAAINIDRVITVFNNTFGLRLVGT